MKTARLFACMALPFFFSGKLLAQKALDGREIAVPDQSSLVAWLSTDGIFAIGLAVGLVCLILWLIHLVLVLMITVQPPQSTHPEDGLSHPRPSARIPHLAFEMPVFRRFGAGLMPVGRKSKITPGSKSGKTDSGDPARRSDSPQRT